MSSQEHQEIESKMRDPHHGNTPAAWTSVIIILIGFLVGTGGVIAESMPVFWIGVVIVAVGAISAKVLAKMGYGQFAKSR